MVNYNCTFLDVCKIEIGDNTLIGPNTGIYTACHPVDKDDRLNGLEYGKSIKIEQMNNKKERMVLSELFSRNSKKSYSI